MTEALRQEHQGVVRPVLALFRPYRLRVAALTVTIVAYALVGVAVPLLTKVVFDRALFPESGEPRSGLLVVLVLMMVVLIAAGGALAIVQAYLASRVAQSAMHDLRDRLYGHLRQMPMRFFTGTKTGEIQSRLANDVAAIGVVASRSAPRALSSGIVIVASLVVMIVLSWQLVVVMLPVFVLFGFVGHRAGRERRVLALETQETLAEMTSITQETLSVSGALLGKAFDGGANAGSRYGTESLRLADLEVRQQMVARIRIGLVQTSFLLGPALVYLGAGLAMSRGVTGFTPGLLVAFTALQVRLFAPLREILEATVDLHAAAAPFERVQQYLQLVPEITDAPGARALGPDSVRGAVAFEGVWFRYGSDGAAPGSVGEARGWTLEDVSFAVEPGQLVALVGPSGAGKTTVTYLVPRLYDAVRGRVTIDGVDVRSIRLASLGELVGMVTQETYLFHASVRENLLLAKPGATDEELEAACGLALIHDRVAELERGYDTVVGERGYRLSGGERQRLAIARAILKDSRILILDEATSSLDTAGERLVQAALRPLMQGRTTIAVAHRLSTIVAADLILVLDCGRIVERGSHAELLARGGMYAAYYAAQFGHVPPEPLAAA